MMSSSALTNDVSFHDSILERVERVGFQIILHLDSVSAHPRYLGDESNKGYVVLRNARVICDAAQTRKLELWTDTSAPIEHPDPARPIVEIMDNDLHGDILEISGFGPLSGWVEWWIRGRQFTLQWDGVARHEYL